MAYVKNYREVIVIIRGEGEDIVIVVIIIDRVMISALKNPILAIYWVIERG